MIGKMLEKKIIYVDVDDTIMRSFGSKRIQMPLVITEIKKLYDMGHTLYCWSSGGKAYAKESDIFLEIDYCFVDFLPKPKIMIDDMSFNKWDYLEHILPLNLNADKLN